MSKSENLSEQLLLNNNYFERLGHKFYSTLDTGGRQKITLFGHIARVITSSWREKRLILSYFKNYNFVKIDKIKN